MAVDFFRGANVPVAIRCGHGYHANYRLGRAGTPAMLSGARSLQARASMPLPSTERAKDGSMDDEAKHELQSILATYRARLVDSQERETKLRNARASFIDVFRTLKAETIAPVLEDFAAQLIEAGHQATVVDQRDASDRNGHFTPSSIALQIVPVRIGDAAATQSGSSRIEVTFSGNQQTMKVLVSSSNNANGAMGKRGEHELSELTKDFVVSNVLKTIREAFAIGN